MELRNPGPILVRFPAIVWAKVSCRHGLAFDSMADSRTLAGCLFRIGLRVASLAAGARWRERKSDRPADDGREDIEKPEDYRASFRRVRSGDLEFEKIEAGEALDRGTAGDRVMTGAFPRGGTPRAFCDIQRNRNGRAVELIGEFGTAERKPSNHDAPELDGEAVCVETMEGRSGSGEHRRLVLSR